MAKIKRVVFSFDERSLANLEGLTKQGRFHHGRNRPGIATGSPRTSIEAEQGFTGSFCEIPRRMKSV
jgi:hypothetical protein